MLTPCSGDSGADLIATDGAARLAIQTKRFGSTVGPSAVQEVVASLAVYKAAGGMVVTNSTFSPGSISLAKANGVRPGNTLDTYSGNAGG